MGGSGSKLRKHLQRGDEYAALQICQRHPDLRKLIDPNMPYSPTDAFTPLHHASRLAMKGIIRIFLFDLGGNPNKQTQTNATALHLVCTGGGRGNPYLDANVRADSLQLFLSWKGPQLDNLERETPIINARDNQQNTPLHCAAGSGLRKCVQLLVSAGAELSAENEAKETPCDVAERRGHTDIAQFLEAKMLFSPHVDIEEENTEESIIPVVEAYSGLKEQDLIEAKDLLLVETSDMLQVTLYTAEALLRNHEWSRQALWTAWNADPVKCCEKCGVEPPPSLLHRKKVHKDQPGNQKTEDEQTPRHSSIVEDSSEVASDRAGKSTLRCQIIECEICTEEVRGEDGVASKECGHLFCFSCWKEYATVKIESGDVEGMSCPAFGCPKVVPLDLVERVVSPSIARKYLSFDINAFVESNPRIKWCPYPGCGNAVRLPEEESGGLPPYMRVFPKLQPPPPTSASVTCPSAHIFCWDCLSDGHEPTDCQKWRQWHEKIAEVKPEELSETGAASEAAANCLWLVTHSKPCPKCKSPIQKNEGCNHMKCSKCKQDFCWVCLGPWKKHNTETGGYFRCNRYDETKKVEQKTDQALAQVALHPPPPPSLREAGLEAKEESRKAQELNRFLHYYTRFKNHLNSHAMEKRLLTHLPSKVENLSKSAHYADVEDTGDFSFVKTGIEELLRSRRALSSSYAYGYFLPDAGYNKTIFEYLQNELEVSVESLSGLVGRPYLRGSKGKISHTTHLVPAPPSLSSLGIVVAAEVGSRRQRFLVCISRGLVPPETPPNLRKSRRRHLPSILGLDKDDDDWVKAGLPPLEDLDPSRPWVKDGRGRHHNLMTILDWPDEEPEELTESAAAAIPAEMRCGNGDCGRSKVRNPRTRELHGFCSLRCQYAHNSRQDAVAQSSKEYNVDLMIALQMSRLQLLQDLRHFQEPDEEPGWSGWSAEASTSAERKEANPDLGRLTLEDMDPDIQLAIERSVSDLSWAKHTLQESSPRNVEQLIRGIAHKDSTSSADNTFNIFQGTEDDVFEKNSDKVLIAKGKDK